MVYAVSRIALAKEVSPGVYVAQRRQGVAQLRCGPCCGDGGGGGSGCACCELQERCGWLCADTLPAVNFSASIGECKIAITPFCSNGSRCASISLERLACDRTDTVPDGVCDYAVGCNAIGELKTYSVCPGDDDILARSSLDASANINFFKQFSDLPWGHNPPNLEYAFGELGPLHGQIMRLRLYMEGETDPFLFGPAFNATFIIDYAIDLGLWRGGVKVGGGPSNGPVSESCTVTPIGQLGLCLRSYGARFRAEGTIDSGFGCHVDYAFDGGLSVSVPVGTCQKDGDLEPLFPGQATPGLPGA